MFQFSEIRMSLSGVGSWWVGGEWINPELNGIGVYVKERTNGVWELFK